MNDSRTELINREIEGINRKIQAIEQTIRTSFATRHKRKRLEREISNVEGLIEINTFYSNPETEDFMWIN